MITVYTLCYNEQLLIQFMIDHYRVRFPGCHIVIYDNSSTDKTVEIAKNNNCEIRTYNSGGTLNDGLHMRIKNSCWKDAKTDWVLMCDMDEMLNLTQEQLLQEECLGTTIIKTEAFTMVNLTDATDKESLSNIDHGFRDPGYDKNIIFNKKFIKEINYGPGCHTSNPIGSIIYSKDQYKLYHYQYISQNAFVSKRMETAKRLSAENRKHGWGVPQCSGTVQDKIADISYRRNHVIKVK